MPNFFAEKFALYVAFACLTIFLVAGCDSKPNVAKQVDAVSIPNELAPVDDQVNDELDELRELALSKKGDKAGLSAGLELFAKSRGEAKNEAMGFLLENFGEKLNYKAMVASFLKEIPSPGIENWLQQMIAASAGENQARATLAYARYVDQIPEYRSGFEKNPHLMAKLPATQQQYLKAERTARQREQLAAHLRQVIETAHQGTIDGVQFSTVAKKELFELENLSVGMVAPDIVGEDLDGIVFRLSDYRGKVVMLDFWGHWCPPCRSMYPQEQELVSQLASSPFVLIGVNSDGNLDEAREAVEDEGLVWRHFWNGERGTSGHIAEQWNIVAWPTVYLIDGDGVIRHKDILGEELDRAIEQLLAEQGHSIKLTLAN